MVSQTTQSDTSSKDAVARSAFRVSLGGLFALIVGFGTQVVVASIFGAGAEMDAFFTALVVPIYLEAVLVAGLTFVVVPAFVQDEIAGREDDAWALAGAFLWLVGGALAVVAVIGSLAARWIIGLSAPEFNPVKSDLAASMLAILMFSIPMTGLRCVGEGIQNSRNRFFWPAVGPAIGSLGNLTTILLLHKAIGPMALAFGYLVYVALYSSVTLAPVLGPVLRRGWSRLTPLGHPRVREMLKLLAPLIFFGMFIRCTPLFERYYASGLPDGDLSYLGYAYKISSIVMNLAGVSIAIAIYPAMSRAYAKDGEAGLIEHAEFGIRLSMAIALPALAILSATAITVVTVLYERGAFQHAATLSVGVIIPIVALGDLVFRMLRNVIDRTFFVTKDTRTVSVVSALTSVLYIFAAKVLVDNWGYVGLAAAQPLYLAAGIVALSLLLMRRLEVAHVSKLCKDLLIYGAASLAAFVAARLVSSALGFLPPLAQFVGASSAAGLLYLALLFWLDRDILRSILQMMGVHRIARKAKIGLYRIANISSSHSG